MIFFSILWYLLILSLCLSLSWLAYKCMREIEKRLNLNDKLHKKDLSLVVKIIRIVIIVIIAVLILQNLGLQLSGVLTISAAGSFILALGAKDVLYNLGGGLMLHIDRVFAVGDEIRVQYATNSTLEGQVEHIGWRITRLRTKEGKAMYVPNVIFVTMPLENLSNG